MKHNYKIEIETQNSSLLDGDLNAICEAVSLFLNENGISDFKVRLE